MLSEQESLVYKHFAELVANCNLVGVMKRISTKDPSVGKLIANLNINEDYRHNNRLILFDLMKLKSETIFYHFTESLRDCKYHDLANKLENKPLESLTGQIDTQH